MHHQRLDPPSWRALDFGVWNPHELENFTCSLHCSSFLVLSFRILNTKLVKPTSKGTTMETIGKAQER